MAKKPAISLGPISDDLCRMLKKALMQGGSKSKQAKRILTTIENKAGGILSNSPNVRNATAIRKAGRRGLAQVDKSAAKRADMKLTDVMSKKHMADMKKAGKNWDGSPSKASKDGVKKNTKSKKENTKLGEAFVQKAKNDKIITSYGKQIGRGEVMAKRATGRYESTTGRVKYIPKDAAAAAGRESTGINKGVAKRTRTDGQKNVDLKKAVTDAKTAEARREARKVLREFQDRTGFR
jgi:hypothetical protein